MRLELKETEIESDGARSISDILKTNTGLTELILADSKIGTSGLVSICRSIKTNSSIVQLDLSGCHTSKKASIALTDISKITRSNLKRQKILSKNLKSSTETGILKRVVSEKTSREEIPRITVTSYNSDEE